MPIKCWITAQSSTSQIETTPVRMRSHSVQYTINELARSSQRRASIECCKIFPHNNIDSASTSTLTNNQRPISTVIIPITTNHLTSTINKLNFSKVPQANFLNLSCVLRKLLIKNSSRILRREKAIYFYREKLNNKIQKTASLVLFRLQLFLLTLLFLLPSQIDAKKINEVQIDWTLESDLFHKGDGIITKYVRMKDVLSIRCAPVISFKIFMVPKESALFCRTPAADAMDGEGNRLRYMVGTCSPNSSHPTIKIRSTSLANSPVFHPGHSYFLITTSIGTSDGVENNEGGLCHSHGMRLRLLVMNETDEFLPSQRLTNFGEIFPNLRANDNHHNVISNNRNTHIERSDENQGIVHYQNNQKQPSSSIMPISQRHVPVQQANIIGTMSTASSPQRISVDSGGSDSLWVGRQHRHDGTKSNIRPQPQQRIDATALSSTSKSYSNVFPAILTLEENGRIKTITVHNPRQLQEEINYASQRNNRIQQIREYATNWLPLPEYTMTGHGKISAFPSIENRQAQPNLLRERNRHNIDGGIWPRNSANSFRRNAARAHLDESIENNAIAQDSIRSTSSENNGPASNTDGRKHLPIKYVVGYNSADPAYDNDFNDDMRSTTAFASPSNSSNVRLVFYAMLLLLCMTYLRLF